MVFHSDDSVEDFFAIGALVSLQDGVIDVGVVSSRVVFARPHCCRCTIFLMWV